MRHPRRGRLIRHAGRGCAGARPWYVATHARAEGNRRPFRLWYARAPMDAGAAGYGLLEAIGALEPEIVARAQAIEDAGQLPIDLVQQLTDLGCWDMLLPREYGGLELPLRESMEIIEELSRIDGSVGWNLMIGVSSGMMSTLFAPEIAREIWT